MPFDPNFPPDHQALIAKPYRDNYNALKALIDAQQIQINYLQQQINALNPLAPPVLDRDGDNDADRLTLSKASQPTQPDEWLGWNSQTGIGNPDTHPNEWHQVPGFDDDNSDDSNWVIEWDGFENNNYFIAAYRVGNQRSPFSNIAH